jgi:hypothetical protein
MLVPGETVPRAWSDRELRGRGGGRGEGDRVIDACCAANSPSVRDDFRLRDRPSMPSPLGEVRERLSLEAERPDGEGGARQEVDALGLGAGEALVEGEGEAEGEAFMEGEGELLGDRRGEGRGKSWSSSSS